MSDLIERLTTFNPYATTKQEALQIEAADLIEEQQAEIARLRGHVENLCCLLDVIKEYWIDYDHVFTTGVGEARAELEQKP